MSNHNNVMTLNGPIQLKGGSAMAMAERGNEEE